MNKSAIGVLMTCACAALFGCSSAPMAPPASATPPTGTAPPAPSSAGSGQSAAPSAAPMAAVPAYLDPNNPIATERSVYFDFDVYSVKDEYRALIERQGKYLSSMPQLSITIEGNTDERGSAEYNLALGQKRAESVRKALDVYGVKESQLEAVSWGSERPKAQAHDEAAWAQNRRADLSYPKQ